MKARACIVCAEPISSDGHYIPPTFNRSGLTFHACAACAGAVDLLMAWMCGDTVPLAQWVRGWDGDIHEEEAAEQLITHIRAKAGL